MFRLPPRYIFTKTKPVVVKRKEAGSWVGGRYVEPAAVEITIQAHVQTLQRGTDTLILPEAQRSRAKYLLITNDPIRSLLEGEGGHLGDIVVWEGEELEVLKVLHYSMGTLDHYEAILARVEQT